ncbi:MAG: hypothetical protein ACUVRV_08315 [Cyanobacteriota bacterium]
MNRRVHLQADRLGLFVEYPSSAAALWHGPSLTGEKLAAQMEADVAYPLFIPCLNWDPFLLLPLP